MSYEDEMSSLYREPSIDASYQVSDQLALWFQRRRLKCEKLADDRRQVMPKTHIAFVKIFLVLFQNGVRQLRSPAKMATTVQLRCY
jgi:hypothetical protein